MRASRLFNPVLIGGLYLFTGCAFLEQPLHQEPSLSLIERPRWHRKIQDDRELAKRFIACSGQAYGEQSVGEPTGIAPQDGSPGVELARVKAAKLVKQVVKNLDLTPDEGKQDLKALLTQLIDTDEQKIKLGSLGSRLKKYIAKREQRLGLGRYINLATTPQLVDHLHARIRDDEDQMARTGSRFERLLVAYNRAYFGEISFKAALEGGQRAVEPKRINEEIRTVPNGFVDRNGTTFAFPGLSANLIVANKPFHLQSGSADSRRIASDLTRIFLEALFDAAFQVPAVDGATALKIEGYPRFDSTNPPIPIDELAKITTDALRAEAAVISHVGELVRGGGGLGINNETLASVLETAAGVIAKKLAEHELFCYFRVRSGT